MLKTTRASPAWLRWLLRLGLGVAAVALLVRWQGAEIQSSLRHASWSALLTAVAWYLSTQIISAFKWKILLSAALKTSHSHSADGSTPETAPTPTLPQCYRIYLIGMFCNLWLPTSVGGDAIRATLAGKRWGSFSLAASSILIERITGLIALLAIGVGGWLFWWPQASTQNPQSSVFSLAVSALAALGVLLSVLFVLRMLAYSLEARSNSKLIAKWAGIHRALDLFATPQLRPVLLQALGLSFAFQSTQILLHIFLARAVGLDLPTAVFGWLVPSLAIASMIPLGIGGLGVREGVALALLQGALSPQMMANTSVILAWSLLWQATLWLSGLPGALVYFAQYEKHPKEKRAS